MRPIIINQVTFQQKHGSTVFRELLWKEMFASDFHYPPRSTHLFLVFERKSLEKILMLKRHQTQDIPKELTVILFRLSTSFFVGFFRRKRRNDWKSKQLSCNFSKQFWNKVKNVACIIKCFRKVSASQRVIRLDCWSLLKQFVNKKQHGKCLQRGETGRESR